jgi:hypothetical protein
MISRGSVHSAGGRCAWTTGAASGKTTGSCRTRESSWRRPGSPARSGRRSDERRRELDQLFLKKGVGQRQSFLRRLLGI